MQCPLDLDWIALCPEQFRQTFKEIVEHPPGTPEGARYFCYEDGAPMTDPPVFPDATPEERRAATQAMEEARAANRRKFAYAWGKYAEAITARHILLQGLPLREWGWRPSKGVGEIDLITQRGSRIIFVEVKARNGKNSDPWDAITPAKIRELCRGANIYLRSQQERLEYQFDVALITGSYDDFELEYIEDAFMCPLTTTRRR